jgi:hypothetical protein
VQLWHLEASEELIKNPKLVTEKAEGVENKLKMVSERIFKINHPLKGVFDFLQPKFDSTYFSVADLTVHTVLMGKHN